MGDDDSVALHEAVHTQQHLGAASGLAVDELDAGLGLDELSAAAPALQQDRGLGHGLHALAQLLFRRRWGRRD